MLLLLDNKTHVQLSGDAKSLPTTYSVKGSKDAEVLRQLTQVMEGSKASSKASASATMPPARPAKPTR